MRKKPTIEQKWHDQALAYKQEAAKLPHGRERDELLRKARQLETASHLNDWLTSPGLTPPIKGDETISRFRRHKDDGG